MNEACLNTTSRNTQFPYTIFSNLRHSVLASSELLNISAIRRTKKSETSKKCGNIDRKQGDRLQFL